MDENRDRGGAGRYERLTDPLDLGGASDAGRSDGEVVL